MSLSRPIFTIAALLTTVFLLQSTASAQEEPPLDSTGETPSEEVPADEPPAEETEAPVEAPAEGETAEAPVEEAPVEEAPVEAVPVEAVPVEAVPVEEGAPATEELTEPAPTAAPTAAEGLADPTTEPAVEDDAEEEDPPLWSLSGELGTSLGLGTFVANEYARNSFLDWSLAVIPAWHIDSKSTLSARIGISQELTDSDSSSVANQVLLSDMFLNVGRSLYTIPVAEVDISAALRVYLPTSLASQHAGLYLGARASLGLSRTFGPVTVGYTFRFRKNFHQYVTPTVDSSETEILARAGGNERVDALLVSTGGNNVSYTFSNYLSVGIAPWDFLSFSILYGLNNSFTYSSFPMDELSSPHAEGGRGQRDVSEAVIEAAWAIDDRFSLSGGIYTAMAPLSEDNSALRFPFFDFESQANNLTTFYLTFSASMDASDIENLSGE